MHKAITSLCGAWIFTGVIFAPVYSQAQEQQSKYDPNACVAEEIRLEKHRYLRAMSLDLRQQLPNLEEYARLSEGESSIDEILDGWLSSEAFGDRMVRHHRSLIWNNLSSVPLMSAKSLLVVNGDGIYGRPDLSRNYRGSDVSCRNVAATTDSAGEIEYEEGQRTFMVDRMRVTEQTRREGFVEIEPYWAPGTKIKVCAYDAQNAATTAAGTNCASKAGFDDIRCGCGDALQYCVVDTIVQDVNRAIEEDVDRRIKHIILNDEPYTELFTSRRAFVNGPLVHFYRHQSGFPKDVSLEPAPVDVDRLPNLSATAKDTWREIELPEYHAGLLTSPAYLLRFTTNRARANRLFDAFMCSPLTPPAGGLVFNQVRPNPDLQRRDGCKYCHANLEPTAAFWGRWGELGAGFLDPVQFPKRRSDCETCARTGEQCSAECRRFYVMSALTVEEEPYLGMLKAFRFRQDVHERHVEEGPKLLVINSIVDSRFGDCVSKKIAARLMGRTLLAEESDWLKSLAQEFVSSNYSYKALVKAIVKSENYRRVQ
jgi:hypothetical protein